MRYSLPLFMDKFFEKIVYIVCFLRIYLVFILWNLTLRSSLKLHCTSYHWVSNCRTLRTSSFLILLLRWSCIHLIWWLISPWNLINLIFLFFFGFCDTSVGFPLHSGHSSVIFVLFSALHVVVSVLSCLYSP